MELAADECDVTRFSSAVAAAGAVLDGNPAHVAQLVDGALTLWRGQPYAEFADEPFAAAEIARLAGRSLAAEIRIDAALLMGRPSEAIVLAELAIARSALRERPRAQLMLALCRCGRQVEALAAFADFRALLDDDLGLAPSADRTAAKDPASGRSSGPSSRP